MRFRNFEASNFRLFENIQLSNLKRINLIAGKNNVGKTSLLESMFLHTGFFNPELTIRIEGFRGMASWTAQISDKKSTPWDNLFYNFDNTKVIKLSSEDFNNKSEETRISIVEDPTDLIDDYSEPNFKEGDITSLATSMATKVINIQHKSENIMLNSYLLIDEKGMRRKPRVFEVPYQSVFHPSRLRFSPKVDTDRYSKINIEGKGDMVIDAINIIDNRIKNVIVSTLGNIPQLYVDIGLDKYIPLLIAGEGMVKIVQLVLAILEAKDGVVFLDEFENGFHHSILPKVWNIIDKSSLLFNTQIFATTHSIETIKAAHNIFSKKKDYEFKLFRLEKIKDMINVISYEEDVLENAIELDLEVR